MLENIDLLSISALSISPHQLVNKSKRINTPTQNILQANHKATHRYWKETVIQIKMMTEAYIAVVDANPIMR